MGDNCGNKLRSYKYYIYAREMPFYGQIIQLFCLIQKPFKLIFCLRQHLEAYFIQSLETVVFFTSSVGSSIKVSVFISTVRPCKIPTLKSCFTKGKEKSWNSSAIFDGNFFFHLICKERLHLYDLCIRYIDRFIWKEMKQIMRQFLNICSGDKELLLSIL